MFWIILSVLLWLVAIGGLIWWALTRNPEPGQPKVAGWGIATFFTCVVVWVLLSAGMSYHNIAQREIGLAKSFTGTIGEDTLKPGSAWTAPWNSVIKEDVGIQHDEWTFDQNNAAVSIDQQRITALIGINYQLDPLKVVDLYEKVGPGWKKIIIDARVPQVFKEITATFTTPELTQKREQLRIKTRERLVTELARYDITVNDVFIRNLGFSESYTQAIEAKQAQVQAALTAQAKVKQIEAEADQKIAAAKGEATANVARARGEATANRLRQKSLTKLLVQQQAIEKLNPKVSLIICPPQTVCVPNSGAFPAP